MKLGFFGARLGAATTRRVMVALLCVVVALPVAAQEVTVEFEDFFTDFAKFDEYTQLPGPLITGGSNDGVGGSGGLTLPGKHALTYTPLSFGFADGDAVTTSAFFKTGNLTTPMGFNEIIGQVYITSTPSGNPIEFFGSNDFFASVYRDSSDSYLGISGQTAGGSFWPFIQAPVTLQSNRWYELSATFTSIGQTNLHGSFRVTDYGANGTAAQGVVGTTTASFSGQASNLADTTWYGGFGADADNGVRADRFRLDVPGNVGGPTLLAIEPTYDVTYHAGGSPRFLEGENTLTIDGGTSTFPVLRTIAEFDLGSLPNNAVVTGASLVIEPVFSQSMTIRAFGYSGDGQLTTADPAVLTFLLGETAGALQAEVEKTISLNASTVNNFAQTASHLAIVLESKTVGPFVDIFASEAASGTAPTLLLEYTLPAANGDFDGDADVDGNDLLVWQRGESPRPNTAADLAEWRSNFGRVGASETTTAVPEPAIGMLAACAVIGAAGVRGRGGSIIAVPLVCS
jgi:hypothetical protein